MTLWARRLAGAALDQKQPLLLRALAAGQLEPAVERTLLLVQFVVRNLVIPTEELALQITNHCTAASTDHAPPPAIMMAHVIASTSR